MRKWLGPVMAMLGLATLAASARWWAPLLLAFMGANTDLIQGLSGLVQLLLWVGAGVSWSVGMLRERRDTKSKHRRIDAAVPKYAKVGQRIDLLVQVRFPDSPLLGIEDEVWPTKQKPLQIEQAEEPLALEFPMGSRTGKLGSANLEIRVVAPDFVVEGTDKQLVEIPPDQYSKLMSFLLTARKAGNCRINVQVYRVDHVYLGTIPVETTVVETTVGEMPATRALIKVANLFLFVQTVETRQIETDGGACVKRDVATDDFIERDQVSHTVPVQGSVAKARWPDQDKTAVECKGETEMVSVQELHPMLTERFDEEELRTLCYYLEIDYDSLRGEGKAGKARELIADLDRRGQISKLVETGRQLRPDIAWGHVSEVTEQISKGRAMFSVFGSGAIAIEGGVAAGAGGIAAGRDVHIHVEPFRLADEGELTQFPPAHLVSRLEPVRQGIAQVLQSAPLEQKKFYFRHADQVIEYLAHFVGLLPPASRLSDQEAFTLLAAAYLYGIGRYLPQPECSTVLKSRMTAGEEHAPVQVPRLVRDYYHELSWEWIRGSLEDGIYPSLGLTPRDPVSEIALVCLGHRDADLDSDRYRASGTGTRRVRPALLAALLSVADTLALASCKPGIEDLRQSEEPLETQLYAWLRYYLERVSIQDGHVRFHYQLPTLEYGPSVRVLLSGPIQLRWREIRGILSKHGLVIVLDSAVESGPVQEMPPDMLEHAQHLAHQRLISTTGALGRPSKPKNLYHFTGFRGRPTLRWSSVEGAERYRCQLFDLQQHLLARWETTALEITLPEDQVESGVQYEWITDAYRGKRRLRGWEGGIFWLVDAQMARWIDRQTAWYETLAPFERQLMQARILANYGLYEEASAVYRAVLEQGTEMAQLQARQELIALYEDISRCLNCLNKPSRSDQYLDAALTLARELQARIAQERLQVKKVCRPPRPADL